MVESLTQHIFKLWGICVNFLVIFLRKDANPSLPTPNKIKPLHIAQHLFVNSYMHELNSITNATYSFHWYLTLMIKSFLIHQRSIEQMITSLLLLLIFIVTKINEVTTRVKRAEIGKVVMVAASCCSTFQVSSWRAASGGYITFSPCSLSDGLFHSIFMFLLILICTLVCSLMLFES